MPTNPPVTGQDRSIIAEAQMLPTSG